MIYKLIIFDVFLVIALLVLVLILVKKSRKNRYSQEVKDLEKRLNDAIEENKEDLDKSEDIKYVGSPKNRKYHLSDCRFVELLKEKEIGTLEEFKKKKYSPCGTCLKK